MVYDNASSGKCAGTGTGCSTGTSQVTISHTTGSGSDRSMIVGCAVSGPSGAAEPAISTITYAGGQSLSQKKSQGGNYRLEYWALPDGTQPTIGANNVVITLVDNLNGLNSALSCGVITFTGVDQTAQFTSSNNGNGGTGTTASLTLSANGANDMGFNFVCNGSSVGASTETMRIDATDDGNGACNTLGVATSAGGDTNHSWTVGSDSWLMVGGALKAASGAGGNVKFR